MHTCIVYRSCIILTPCFAAIIDPSESSCVWGRKGGRLVREDLSPRSIAREILHKLESRPINPLCLEAASTSAEQTEEMEPQQGGNWTLEDIKGALMDDMKAMMQEELRQALAGLMSPQAPAAAANPPAADAPPVNNDNAGGQPLNAARNVPAVDMKFKDVENYMVEKAKKESLELVQDLESKHMKALNQKMSKMEELMRGQGMGYSFDFDDIMQLDGDKLPDKFKMPQL